MTTVVRLLVQDPRSSGSATVVPSLMIQSIVRVGWLPVLLSVPVSWKLTLEP